MKKILMVGLLALLASCAPAVQSVVKTGVGLAGPAVELAEHDPATFAFESKDALLTNKGADAMTGDPSRPGDGVSLVVVGTADLVVSAQVGGAEACMTGTRAGYWRCFVPAILPGQAFRVVPTRGAIQSGSACYYRARRGGLPLCKTLR